MKNTARAAAVALSVAAMSTGGLAAAAGTVPEATATPAPAAPTLKPAIITASQGSLNLTQMQLENLSAAVADAVTGLPLAGRSVKFTTVGGRLLGVANTDDRGIARLTAPENFGPGTVQELIGGYYATLQGDGIYAPVTAHGPITIGTDTAPG